jgi:hypothetical protein
MLVISLPSLPELIAATTVVLLLVATALALCCCRKQSGGSASTSTDDDDNNNSNTNNNVNNDDGPGDGSQRRRWYFCCFGKKRTQTRDFATLNDLLLEVDENETGWLNVVSTPRSAIEQSSRLEVSVDSFFPDILSEPARKGGRGRTATGGSREDLHETLL